MPYFRYIARDKSGNLKDETVEAVNKDDLIASLQASGYYIVSLGIVSELKKRHGNKIRYHRSIKNSDLIMFARELAILLGSGVTLIKSLEVLCKQVQSYGLLKAVQDIKKDVESGYTFQNAMAKHRKIFSDFWIHLVETGEASGHLPLSLERLADYLEESEALRKKIISAMIYPVLLIGVSILALTIFFVRIVPIFSDIFNSFEVQIPLLTQIVIMISNMVRKYFFAGMITFVAAIFVIKKYISTELGRFQFDSMKLKLPIIGELTKEIATERFTSGLSTLLKSGVPILHALEIAEKIVGNKIMEKELKVVKIAVRDGKGMSQVMDGIDIFSPLVVQMIGVGEEIGELGKMLEKVAAFYKERVTTFVARLSTLFEPIVLVFMGVMVGFLVLSMFLPIVAISTSVRAGS